MLSICAVSLHAAVSVGHSSVICEAIFSELVSRTHLVRRSGMSAQHHTSRAVSAMVDLVGFKSSVWSLSHRVTILNRAFEQYKAYISLYQHNS